MSNAGLSVAGDACALLGEVNDMFVFY